MWNRWTRAEALVDPTEFVTRLASAGARVEAMLDTRLPQPSGHQAAVEDAMRYSALAGGKRLRPFLVIEAARLFGEAGEGPVLAGAALECVHAYSLVHDDLPCMDDDDLRRGKPTVHRVWDEAMAVLAGDALLTVAFELMADADVHPDPALRLALVADMARAGGTRGMIGGQVVDITVADNERDAELITSLQDMKTGALIRFAATAGARLGGASEAERDALEAYARDLGLVFQITDDILDVEGDADTVGKAVGKDAGLGKATFVSALGLSAAKTYAEELGERACGHLATFGAGADTLRACVDFVLERDR